MYIVHIEVSKMMHWWGWGLRAGPGVMNWIGPAFMLVLWVLIVIGIIFFIRFMVRAGRSGRWKENDVLEILKRRYARGEITKEEFEQKRKDLSV
jgi:putative membrane protein